MSERLRGGRRDWHRLGRLKIAVYPESPTTFGISMSPAPRVASRYTFVISGSQFAILRLLRGEESMRTVKLCGSLLLSISHLVVGFGALLVVWTFKAMSCGIILCNA